MYEYKVENLLKKFARFLRLKKSRFFRHFFQSISWLLLLPLNCFLSVLQRINKEYEISNEEYMSPSESISRSFNFNLTCDVFNLFLISFVSKLINYYQCYRTPGWFNLISLRKINNEILVIGQILLYRFSHAFDIDTRRSMSDLETRSGYVVIWWN